MAIEYCTDCNEPTGNAGYCEDSLYIDLGEDSNNNEIGPFCEDCYNLHSISGYEFKKPEQSSN